MQEDPKQLLEVAISAAQKASKIVNSGFINEVNVNAKSSFHDVLTEYDIKSEKIIIDYILHHFKDHAIISEESVHATPNKDQIYWIIDPIDGTWNFAKKIPQFCISIAAAKNNELLAGVILVPIVNDLYTAARGSGAFLNKERLIIKEPQSLYHSCISLKVLENINISQTFGMIRRSGSTALDLAYIAASKIDAILEKSTHPWDIAAGTLLIQEAGGIATTLDNDNLVFTKQSNIIASSKSIHKELVKLINTTL